MATNGSARPSRSRRPSLAVRVLFALFVLVTSAASGEVVLRAATRATARMPRPVDPDARDLPELKDSWAIMKPNARGRFYDRLYEANSEGFRGPEISLGKPPGTFRIMAIGDSYTNGQGVRYEESYPALVSGILNGSRDPRRYEVVDLGIGGFNLQSSVLRLRERGLKFQPDLLVYGFTVNDIEGFWYRKSRHDGPPAAVTPSRLLNLALDQWSYLRDLFWHARGSYLWELDDNYFRNEAAWEDWKADLADLRRIASQRNICVLMLIHTELTALHGLHPYKRYYEAVSQVARDEGVPVQESFPYYRSMDPRDLWVNFYDRHPNPAGHAVLATALLDGLRALPASCWKGQPPIALAQAGG
jgi:lysophospholipase L1-like esterase